MSTEANGILSRRKAIALFGMLASVSTVAGGQSRLKPALIRDLIDTADNFGSDLSEEEFQRVQAALHPDMLDGTDVAVRSPATGARRVVLDNLPAIAAQGVGNKFGSPGSCEAQSFGYCLGAYTAARLPDGSRRWSAANPHNQPSAAWLYQWAHQQQSRSCPKGSKAVPYARKLVMTGAPSTADFPYNPSGENTIEALCQKFEAIDTSVLPADASRLEIGSYKAFHGIRDKKDDFLETFKSLIRHGHAIAFSGLVANGYAAVQPDLRQGVFTAADGFKQPSGHGQCIVGFDDDMGPHGAFLVQNSFGTQWNPGPASDPGRNGRIWYGYNAFFAGQQLALIMFPNHPGQASGTRLAGPGSSAPLFVRSAQRHTGPQGSVLVLVLHCQDPVEFDRIQLAGPDGITASETADEVMRFGYVYFRSQTPFPPGRYQVEIGAERGGRWSGGINLT